MIQTEKILYKDSELLYEGFISWDDQVPGTRPAIMIAHTFRGQGDFENEKSVQLAKLGYLAFAIDLYGQGRRAATPEEASNLMNELNHNRPLLLARILHALETIRQHPLADPGKVAAIGFCFGGKCVLDLARSGVDVRGVVSFHGIYDAPDQHDKTPVKAAVLVLHGWEDPLAKPDSMVALGQELTRKRADWQILAFGHTGHAFTNPNAKDEKGGMFWQPQSNARGWRKMQEFLEELFT